MTGILSAAYQREAFAAGRFLRVVNWHNTPLSQRALLRRELAWYAERYSPVLPEELDRFFDTGRWELPRPGFIPAFYDAYRNHVEVAAPLCDELGITAWFFPPTTSLSVPPGEDQRAYAEAHSIDLVPEEPGPRWLMTWEDLERIAENHVVAAHTASHTAAAEITTTEDAEREILNPVRQLRELTGRTPPAFAFLFGTPPVPGTVAGDAVLGCGVRYATTNTAYVRIAD